MELSEVQIRRLRRSDLFKGGLFVPWHVEGLAAVRAGEIVGFAGVQKFGLHHWAFFNAFDPIVCHPFWLHRLVKNVLDAYAKVGIGPIYSLADNQRWHQRLGFRPVTDDERDEEIRYCETTTNKGAWIRL